MKYSTIFQKCTALTLAFLLSFPITLAGDQSRSKTSAQTISEMSYLEILEEADELQISKGDVEAMKKQFRQDKEAERKRLQERIRFLQSEEKSLQNQLKEFNQRSSRDTGQMSERRKELHCGVLKVQKETAETKLRRSNTVEIEYDNKIAKAELAQRWPAERMRILEQLETGKARQRRYGNVEDIGVRVIRTGQEDDIKRGQEAIKELKRQGIMPPEIEDREVKDYMNELGKRLSANSDLDVPLQVTVLDSDEINAFALPGGFLFIDSGLILKADKESELAGVMAHEIAHVTARHGARLMKKASIANLLFQGAQVAAILLTGGAVGQFTYYALQYGFYGLGLAISLALLGVSRDYELEADQLAVQYLWKAGYEPKSFTTFFDKMAMEKGHVRSTSFFRTHPPFAERLIRSFAEITFLPPKREFTSNTSEFKEMKEHLRHRVEELRKKGPANGPSLNKGRIEQECAEELAAATG